MIYTAIQEYIKPHLPAIIDATIFTFLIFLLAYFVHIVVKRILFRVLRRVGRQTGQKRISARVETLQNIISNTSSILIGGVALVIILAEWGLNITPIITGAGIIGLAVGFGSQTIVRDAVTGFFILFENQYNVGDQVETAGVSGTVKQIYLRTTIIEGEKGKIHIIPNSQITNVTKLNSK